MPHSPGDHPAHGRTGGPNTTRITPATENYLQAIYALTAERKSLIGARLAEHLRVSPPSITQTLQRLAKAGYVELINRGDRKEIVLTDTGRAIGEASARKHRLIERWLQGELKLSSTEAHEAAHGFEAGFTDELLDKLFESIGRPTHCPHGNPIPGSGAELDHGGIYLDEVTPGERVWLGRITEEAEADLDLLEYLERHQVKPGAPLDIVAVDRKTGAITAQTAKWGEIRLEQHSAALIYVRREESVAAG